jgi:hypothetical protein
VNLAGPWPIRVTWLLLPVTVGAALDAALGDRSRPVAVVVGLLAWAAWTVGVVATLVPRTVGLTTLRVLAPLALVAAAWSAAGDIGEPTAVVGLVSAALTTVVALAPTTGDAFVNGSAYGAERRFALRVPGPLLLGPLQVVWLVVVVGALAGPMLLAARVWLPGALALAVGVPAAAVGSRSLHQLARRWLVLVPTGVVVHDPGAVGPQLLRRQVVRRIGPAPADTDAYDLTAGSMGLAIEIRLAEPWELELRSRRGTPPPPVPVDRLIVTPTRPGAVLREAAARGLPVATA